MGVIEEEWEKRCLDVFELEELGHLGAAHDSEERLDDVRAAVTVVVKVLQASKPRA